MTTPTRAAMMIAVWLASAAPIAVASVRAEGCACPRVEAPCAGYWSSPVVFVGRVESVSRTASNRTATITVLENFRGVSSSAVDVVTSAAAQQCGFPFRAGREYLVYANRTDAGVLTTSACSRTRDIEDAAADLTYARAVKDGTAAPGRISGQVRLVPRDLSRKAIGAARPVPDITVRVGNTSTVTNQAGDFAFDVAEPGTFVVSLDVPDRYYLEDAPATVELRDAKSCAEVDPVLYDNGRVTGRVIDASARPVPGVTIELGVANGAQVRRTVTDQLGRYELARLPPGRFTISIDTSQPVRGAGRPHLYYPGVETRAAATRVAAAAGARVALGDFRIPAQWKFVTVAGVVFDADGRPADGARVYLKGAEDDDHILAEPAIADMSGRFVIAALAGHHYRLFAERPGPSGRLSRVDSSDQVRITPVEGVKPVRLTLERRY